MLDIDIFLFIHKWSMLPYLTQLSLNRTNILGMMTHTFNLRAWEEEAGSL